MRVHQPMPEPALQDGDLRAEESAPQTRIGGQAPASPPTAHSARWVENRPPGRWFPRLELSELWTYRGTEPRVGTQRAWTAA
jgi:hypothetical protein